MKKQQFVNTDTRKTIEEFLKVVDQIVALWALDCAEHIIQYFEKKYPQDDRPRKAL